MHLTNSQDPKMPLFILDGLFALLSLGRKLGGGDSNNKMLDEFHEAGGVFQVERLLSSENAQILRKAYKILDTFTHPVR